MRQPSRTARRPAGIALLLAGALAATTAPGAVAASPHWSYAGNDGPDRWATMAAEFTLCAAGRQQSPIDLAGAIARDLANPQLAYTATSGSIVDNGHTVQVDLAPGSSLTLDGVSYQLVQFHLHSPSEHTIDGSSYPVELHLVHRAESGALAVVGVLIAGGAQNPALAPLLAVLPSKVGRQSRLAALVDPSTLLPDDRRAYRYAGSLTTPPCSEGVSWVVMATPITASGPQIAALARLLQGNARPPQPRNERELLLDSTP